MRPVSAYKKLLTFLALVAVVLVATPATSEAQGRYRGGRSRVVVVGGGFYSSPFFYDPWYGYQYPPFGVYPPYRYYGYAEASVQIDVKPKDAQVYVDGYYAGVVDDFDGAFQRLRVEPGEHEIEIYMDGFHPFRQKVYLAADRTFKIRQALQPLAAGEQAEPRPQPPAPPQLQPGQPPPQQGQGQGPGQPMPRGPVTRRMPPPPQGDPGRGAPPPPRGGQSNSAYGSLSVRVQPLDAEVSIDGEAWRGPGGTDRLVIEMAEGSHTVEIRKAGFRTYVTQVEIRRGETAQLNVSLRNE
jgi:hypothetical protein